MILGLVERRPAALKGIRSQNELSDLSRESHRAHCHLPFAGGKQKVGFTALLTLKKVRSVVCALWQLLGNTA